MLEADHPFEGGRFFVFYCTHGRRIQKRWDRKRIFDSRYSSLSFEEQEKYP